MNGNNVFQSTGANRVGRSVFDLSYERKFDLDFGQLIPVACEEVLPGDIMEIGSQAIFRFNPLVAPILHEINIYTHYYFVPNRLMWDEWEEFISKGPDGLRIMRSIYGSVVILLYVVPSNLYQDIISSGLALMLLSCVVMPRLRRM